MGAGASCRRSVHVRMRLCIRSEASSSARRPQNRVENSTRLWRVGFALAGTTLMVAALVHEPLLSQAAEPTNEAPNPYQTIENHFKLPVGRVWGATSAVDMAPDGQSIWVADRCGPSSCVDRTTGQMSKVSPILRFDLDGNLIASFGAGLLASPHGIHVDAQGNVWVTDNGDNAPTPPAPAAAAGAAPVAAAQRAGAGATVGHQVLKFSPDGTLLMSLGRPGGALAPDHFFQPNDVITNQKGEIFVAEGHSSAPGAHARIRPQLNRTVLRGFPTRRHKGQVQLQALPASAICSSCTHRYSGRTGDLYVEANDAQHDRTGQAKAMSRGRPDGGRQRHVARNQRRRPSCLGNVLEPAEHRLSIETAQAVSMQICSRIWYAIRIRGHRLKRDRSITHVDAYFAQTLSVISIRSQAAPCVRP